MRWFHVGSFDSRVYALNRKTGTLLWSYEPGNLIESSSAVADGAVYIGSETTTFTPSALN